MTPTIIADVLAVASKEWRELLGQRGFRGKAGIVLFLAAFGIILPLQTGRAWITSPGVAIAWSWVPMFLVSTVIADAFAGERERHTLETLLATRLSDNAILFGKIAAAIGYAGAMTIASLLLAGLAVNLATWPDGLVFYSPRMFLTMCALGAGGSIFVAAIGVLISLRAATVRQAQQALGGTVVVLLLLPLVAARLLPAEWKRSAMANVPAAWQLAVAGIGMLLVLDIGAVAIAMHRFTRSRLIVCAVVPLIWSVPVKAQSPAAITAATRDSLLDCAAHMATAAGFTAAPGAAAGRLGLMRTRTTPAGTLVDGMRVALAPTAVPGAAALDVRVSTFFSPRANPFSHQEMSPPKALTALADSIRAHCRPRRSPRVAAAFGNVVATSLLCAVRAEPARRYVMANT